jgi:hypothetical protein
MTPWRRSFPPIDLRPLALAAGLLAGAAQAQPNPAELALSATDPTVASTAAPSLALPEPVNANTPPLPADTAEALAIWRRANARVAEFPRGHADLLKLEPAPAAAVNLGSPMSWTSVLQDALRTRPDLFVRLGSNALTRAQVQAEHASFVRAVQVAWIDAIAATQSARYRQEVLEAARVGTELGRRMVVAGNWPQARLMREQLVEAAAWQSAADAQARAQQAVEQLAQQMGVWDAAAVQALAQRLPDGLPALPAQALPGPGMGVADIEAAALRSDPRMAQQRAEAQAAMQAVPAERWAAWQRAADAAIAKSQGQAPELIERPLVNDHNLANAVQAQAELLRRGAQRRSEARLAWAAVPLRHASARHAEQVIAQLQTAIEQDTVQRYNGMLLSTWDLLASARDRLASLDAALQARADFWRAQANWQAVLAGAGHAGSDLASSSAATPAATAAGH